MSGTTIRARYKPNEAGIKLATISPQMVACLGVLAQQGADSAKSIAPRRTGEYADSIDSDAGLEDGKAVGRYFATDFKANWIEFGTGEPLPTTAFAPLRRAADTVRAGL